MKAKPLTSHEEGSPRTGCKWEEFPPTHVFKAGETVRFESTWSPAAPNDEIIDDLFDFFWGSYEPEYLYLDNNELILEGPTPPVAEGQTVGYVKQMWNYFFTTQWADTAQTKIFTPVPLFPWKKVAIVAGIIGVPISVWIGTR